MSRNCSGSTHQLRSGAARLVRLAAVTCLALVAGSAAVWAQTTGNSAAGHRCIHDEVQQRVLQSVAQEHRGRDTLSGEGLPVVSTVSAPSATELNAVQQSVAKGNPLNVTRSTDWGELRITVSTEDLTDPKRYCKHDGQGIKNRNGSEVTCTADDILTDEKRNILMNSILPEAVRLHTERLKVKQVQGSWKVSSLRDVGCGEFKVPDSHLTSGLNNTDFVLYVGSVPAVKGAVPWGGTCQLFADDHPAVGVLNVPAALIVSRYDQRVIRAVAHQIAHALGFSKTSFKSTGNTKLVEKLRGNSGQFPVINGNTTVAKAREHYNCSKLEYVEMNDPGFPDRNILHLSMRNAKDELMAPEGGAGYYTALTMAIFEDTGFYQADFSKAEVMPWGRSAGCDFPNEKCTDNHITQWPHMFCEGAQLLRCTSSRLDIGKCAVSARDTPMATAYQYFTNTAPEKNSPYMDICPYVKPTGEGACNQNSSTASDDFKTFNVFSDAARCIDGDFKPKNRSTDSRPTSGMCANVKCDNATKTYSIQVKGSSAYVNCTEGQNITLYNISDAFETDSYITCPPYVEVCQGNVKAAMDFKADLEKSRGTSSSSGRGDNHTDSMSSSGRGHTPTDSMPSSGRGHTPADSMPSSGQGHTPTDSTPSSGRGHTPADSMPSSGRGHTPADSMPNSGSGANKPDAASTNGKGDRLYPLGNSAAGLHSARTLVSAGVALLVVTLTVGLSA